MSVKSTKIVIMELKNRYIYSKKYTSVSEYE